MNNLDELYVKKQNGSGYLDGSAFCKTILMFLVIIYHSCVFWTGTWGNSAPVFSEPILSLIAKWLNSFHIYCFALVSGYIFSFKVRGGGYNRYGCFLNNKAKRLLIPYVAVAFIWIIPIDWLLFAPSPISIIKKYVLAMGPSQLWFLWMLFWVFVIVWPLRYVMLENSRVGWAIAVALYGIGIIGMRLLPNVFCIWNACQFVPFFYMGMRIRVKEENGEKIFYEIIPWFGWIVVDLAVFAMCMMISRNSWIAWKVIGIGLTFAFHMVGVIMAWTTLQALASKVNWDNNKFFRMLSVYSMPMYLFHQQIIYFTIILLNGKVNPWINAGVNFMAAFVGSLFISSIMMRWKTTRFLIGE